MTVNEMMDARKYPAKILLFGEYGVLFGGAALAIPYGRYCGCWCKKTGSVQSLLKFFSYLKQISPDLLATFDTSKLDHLEDTNTSFTSDIPIGQGLGSSAALSAAVYQFAQKHSDSLEDARHDLALIEGYFHGRSSGIDALVSYCDKPIQRRVSGTLQSVDLPKVHHTHLFLWHTGIARSTEPLVKWFHESNKDEHFRRQMVVQAQLSSQVIEHFLSGRSYLSTVHQIGEIQWQFMSHLIPMSIRSAWQELRSEDIAVKLCGAGGGGCVLLFTPEEDLPHRHPSLQIEKVW